MRGYLTKILTLEEMEIHLADLRRATAELRIVFTNGAFDLMHVGHLRYLQAARALGHLLIVGLNSDASVRPYKDDRRPIIPQEERAELLAALECVDYIVPFNEPTAERLAAALKPDIYAKGGDYDAAGGKLLPEASVVRGYGGEVRILPLVEGRSTSALIERILELYCTSQAEQPER
jgi:D-glycero-beta-D-manno-heptose 1-phosphate adenylyltransferase